MNKSYYVYINVLGGKIRKWWRKRMTCGIGIFIY